MRISFKGFDLKNKVQELKQKQDERIIENLTKERPRKQCIMGGFGLASAIASSVASPIITKQIIRKGKINIHPLSLNARIGFGILGAGLLAGFIFSKIDEKKNTKLGDFLYKLDNGQISIRKDSSKIDAKA